jgi:hypothetical protein
LDSKKERNNETNILDERELAALENIFNDTVYYLIKSGNEENVSLAKAKVLNYP